MTYVRASTLSTIRESRAALFRMGCVVLTSLAIMVSLPAWLRELEHAPMLFSLNHHPASTQDAAEVPVAPTSAQSNSGEADRYQMLAEFLAKRYRVSSEAVERFIHLAYSAGQVTKLDPLLILAVMAVESSFNPIAESVMGAKGLMQVIPQFHQDKLRTAHGTELNVLDPETNILVGAKVLREYASRTGNDLAAALGLYGGTGPAPDNPYASKVLSERQRLEQILQRAPRRTAVEQALDRKNRT
jgi:soluble lytic murein transglycosylase-like protein